MLEFKSNPTFCLKIKLYWMICLGEDFTNNCSTVNAVNKSEQKKKKSIKVTERVHQAFGTRKTGSQLFFGDFQARMSSTDTRGIINENLWNN